jgi:hypothetical protein
MVPVQSLENSVDAWAPAPVKPLIFQREYSQTVLSIAPLEVGVTVHRIDRGKEEKKL